MKFFTGLCLLITLNPREPAANPSRILKLPGNIILEGHSGLAISPGQPALGGMRFGFGLIAQKEYIGLTYHLYGKRTRGNAQRWMGGGGISYKHLYKYQPFELRPGLVFGYWYDESLGTSGTIREYYLMPNIEISVGNSEIKLLVQYGTLVGNTLNHQVTAALALGLW